MGCKPFFHIIIRCKNTYKIIYQCTKCHAYHKNVMANDDNMDLIITLSSHPVEHI